MIKHYLKVTLRHLWKNRFYSFISILGLALGVAAFLMISEYVRFETSYESIFPQYERIFRVTQDYYKGTEYIVTDCETPMPLGPKIKADMPEVDEFARFQHFSGQEFKFKNQKWTPQNIYAVDVSAFAMFGYKILKGNPSKDFENPFTLVLSRKAAMNYFGTIDVIDKVLTYEEGGEVMDFKVVGVMENLPQNTHLKFDLIFSFISLKNLGWDNFDYWDGNNNYTYVLTNEKFDQEAFDKKLQAIGQEKYNRADSRITWTSEPIADIHLFSHKTFEPETNSDINIIYFLRVIAIFIIFISIINYVNLYAAKSLERSKEISIRRIMGSRPGEMLAQNMFEAALFCLLSGGLSLLFILLAMGSLKSISDNVLSLAVFGLSSFWINFGLLMLACTVASGLYAQMVLSYFHIRDSLRGSPKMSLKSFSLQKVFIIGQFIATFVLVVGTMIVFRQINFMMGQDLGMNLEQVLVVEGPGYTEYETNKSKVNVLRGELLNNPQILSMSSTVSLPGLPLHELSTTTSITLAGEEDKRGNNFYYHEIDEHFIPTLGSVILAGKNYAKGRNNKDYCIINEESMKIFGIHDPEKAIGQEVTFNWGEDSPKFKIGAVIRNFHQQSLKEEHIPMLFYYKKESLGFFAVKMKTDQLKSTLAKVKQSFEKTFPNLPYNYYFLDEFFNRQYQNEVRFAKLTSVFSFMAIFISALGLLGLSTYIALRRTKEIAVRKVLGASIQNIVWVLSKGFLGRILLACLIATPITYIAMQGWLENFAYRTQLSWWIFALGAFGILATAFLTMSIQTLRAALVNPVESLRQE